MRIAIIGGGGWGLALAKLLSENSHQILIWEHNPQFLKTLSLTHSNELLLPGVILPASVSFSGTFSKVAEFSPQIVILATPSQFLRTTLKSIPLSDRAGIWNPSNLLAVVNVAKGVEKESLKTMAEVLQDELPPGIHSRICALSGPSHAEEVARRIPTTVVIAGKDDALLRELQSVFSNSYFRVYRSSDLIGVEIGGAVKNIIAVAAGMVAGLGFGDNTIGALLTRGLVEIQRLGISFGARPETFLGLSGLGDLVTTATSQHSRNRFVGFEIGSGRKLSEVIAQMNMVAEGVETTNSVYHLAKQRGIEMPITEQVYNILYHDKDPLQAITELMTRELKAE